jgi:hypothetical protein
VGQVLGSVNNSSLLPAAADGSPGGGVVAEGLLAIALPRKSLKRLLGRV